MRRPILRKRDKAQTRSKTDSFPVVGTDSRWLALRLLLVQRLPSWRAHSMLLWAAMIGALGALATVGFREFLRAVQWAMTGHGEGLVKAALGLPPWQRVLVPVTGGALAGAVLVLARRMPNARSAPDYMEAISIGDGIIGKSQSLARSLSCALSVGSGASIGREGPMVQLAAMAASWVGQVASFNEARLRLLVACGASAGIASAYNAPIAGALFVCEIVLGSIAMPAFGPLIVASVTASVLIHQLLGYRPTYSMPAFAPVGGLDLFPLAVLGVAIGLAAPLFLSMLELARTSFARLGVPPPLKLALGGLAVGLLSVQVPQVWGNGYSVVDSILNSDWAAGALVTVLACKLLATGATVGSGAVGGVFTPTLFMGAAVGALVAQALNAIAPGTATPSVFAAVGMGAMLAATTHAPLMAIIMVSEMTMSYQLALPLMLACVLSYSVSRIFREDSVYAASLRRQRDARPRRPLGEFRIGDLLKPDRPSIAPDLELPLLAEAFATQRVQYLYVTDGMNRFLGAVSLHEVARRIGEGQSREGVTARHILLPDFPRLRPDMTIGEALAVFAKHHGERLPVVAAEVQGATLLGSVSKTDLLFLMQDNADSPP